MRAPQRARLGLPVHLRPRRPTAAPVKGKKYRPLTPIVLDSVTMHANPIAEAAAQ